MLALLRHQLGDGDVAREAEAGLLHAAHEAHGGHPCAEGQAARREQCGGEVQRRGQARRGEPHAAGKHQAERVAREQLVGIRADQAHQAQQLGVGPDQDVLAVVERQAVRLDAAGAPSQGARRLEHRDGMAAGRQFRGGRHAGVAGADDGDAHCQPAAGPPQGGLKSATWKPLSG